MLGFGEVYSPTAKKTKTKTTKPGEQEEEKSQDTRMSNLPPYSTFRTDPKQMSFPQATSNGNYITFTPPGFKQSLNIKFPDSRLAVCEKCKKNFKTRDMCRVRSFHTSPPWKPAYICITIDDTCLDAQGKYIDEPLTVRMVQWQPYAVKTPFSNKTPVCSACKRTNRTRSFCRERHRHRLLPWCTVFVLLSALDHADPDTIIAEPSKTVVSVSNENDNNNDNNGSATKDVSTPGDVGLPSDGASKFATPYTQSSIGNGSLGPVQVTVPSEITKSKSDDSTNAAVANESSDSDDINCIPPSRTFLAIVSCHENTVHWLDLCETETEPNSQPTASREPSEAAAIRLLQRVDHNTVLVPMDRAQYLAQMQYAAQHQHALKAHQQYYYQMQQQQSPHQHSPIPMPPYGMHPMPPHWPPMPHPPPPYPLHPHHQGGNGEHHKPPPQPHVQSGGDSTNLAPQPYGHDDPNSWGQAPVFYAPVPVGFGSTGIGQAMGNPALPPIGGQGAPIKSEATPHENVHESVHENVHEGIDTASSSTHETEHQGDDIAASGDDTAPVKLEADNVDNNNQDDSSPKRQRVE